MEYMTPKQAGELWEITERRVQALCVAGRVQGAQRLGGKVWLIPKETPKPIDGRTKAAKSQGNGNPNANKMKQVRETLI